MTGSGWAVQGVRRHYEASAQDHTLARGRGLFGLVRRQEQAAVRCLAEVEPGQLVLDIGCGDGETSGWLATRGARVVAVDLVLAMARQARSRGAMAAVADMQHLPLDRQFDWVLCIGALEFQECPSRTLAGFAWALRPGGQLVLLFPRFNPPGLMLWLYHRRHGIHIHLTTRRSWTRWLVEAGFERPLARERCAMAWVCRTQLAGREGATAGSTA